MTRPLFLSLPLVLCLASLSGAQQVFHLGGEGRKGPLEVSADTLTAEQTGAVITGTGHVVVTWEGNRLTGDTVSYDRASSQVTAEGSVVLEDGEGNVLRCQRIRVNAETQEGTVTDGTLWIAREGYRVWGKRFQKIGAQIYRVEGGGFTPCDGTWPSWKVNADKIDVELERYLVARHATFWVEGVPTAYLPYIVFPVKRERQSGFLLPKVGVTGSDGLILSARYYWAFSDSADLTARLEYRSRRGWTEEGELRYAIAEGHEGRADVMHLYDRKKQADRYTVAVDHRSRFDDVTRVRLHVDYLGDKTLLQDLGDTIDQRGVERKENYLVGTRDETGGTFFGLARYVQALQQPQAPVLQTLPQVGFEGRETPLWGPLAWDPTIRWTNYYRREGLEGQRMEVAPGLAWDAQLGGLGVAARAKYRENLYRVEGEWLSRGAASVGVDLSAIFARRYGSDYVHTVEPKVSWLWEETGRGPTPPVFDPGDVFQSGSSFGLLLESRLLRARDLTPVAGVDVERRMDFGEVHRYGSPEGAFGPWRFKGTLMPSEAFRLRAETEYDPAQKDPWLQWSAEAEGKSARGDRLTVGYHYVRGWTSYLDTSAEVPITSALSIQFVDRYSHADKRALEWGGGLHLVHQCWEVSATVSRNYKSDQSGYENRFFLTVQLKGLGNLGTMRRIFP